MSEDYRRRGRQRRILLNLIMNTSIAMTMIVIATTLTYLYMRYGVPATKQMVPRDRIHRNISEKSDLGVTKSPKNLVNIYTIDNTADVEPENNVIHFTLPDSISTGGQTSNDHLDDGSEPHANGRSLDTILIQDGPDSKRVVPSFGLRSKSINSDPRPVYQMDGFSMAVDDDDQSKNNDEPDNILDDAKMYHVNKRPKSQREKNQNDYSNTMNGKSMTQYYSSSYQNTNGLNNNVGGSNYKAIENPSYGTGWITLGNIEQGSSWPGTNGEIIETPPYGPGYRYPTNHEYEYTPPTNSLTTYYNHYPGHHHKYNKNGWKQIIALVLLKLGFLKIMFFLIYKIVIFTRLVSMIFELVKKITDLSNSLPAFLLELFTTFMKISLNALMLFNAMQPVNQSSIPIIPGSNSLASRIRGVIPNLWNNLMKRISSSSFSGRPTQTGIHTISKTIDSRPQGEHMDNHTSGLRDKRSLDLNNLNLVNKYSHASSELFEPTLDIIKNVLDSEKCVERIVCQIAAVEKSSAMPFWFYWLLNGISSIISNDKLESYLKTYKTVNNKMHTTVPVPDNWATWCLDRYDCNNTYVTKITDTRQ